MRMSIGAKEDDKSGCTQGIESFIHPSIRVASNLDEPDPNLGLSKCGKYLW